MGIFNLKTVYLLRENVFPNSSLILACYNDKLVAVWSLLAVIIWCVLSTWIY